MPSRCGRRIQSGWRRAPPTGRVQLLLQAPECGLVDPGSRLDGGPRQILSQEALDRLDLAFLPAFLPAFLSSLPSAFLPALLEPEDLEKVIDAVSDQDAVGARDRAVVLLLARLGLRASEVAALSFDAIDFALICRPCPLRWRRSVATAIRRCRRGRHALVCRRRRYGAAGLAIGHRLRRRSSGAGRRRRWPGTHRGAAAASLAPRRRREQRCHRRGAGVANPARGFLCGQRCGRRGAATGARALRRRHSGLLLRFPLRRRSRPACRPLLRLRLRRLARACLPAPASAPARPAAPGRSAAGRPAPAAPRAALPSGAGPRATAVPAAPGRGALHDRLGGEAAESLVEMLR